MEGLRVFTLNRINRETPRTPRTVAELVTHYTEQELPNKTPYTREVDEGTSTSGSLPNGVLVAWPMFGLWLWKVG